MPEILGVRVDAVNPGELEGKLKSFLVEGGLRKVFTPNAEMLLAAHRDGSFKEVLNSGDLNLVDGFGVVLMHRFLTRLNTNCVHQTFNRITGVDTLELLCRIAAEDERKILLFGSDQGVAENAANAIKNRYPNLSIKGFYPGVVRYTEGKWQFENGSIDDIASYEPDILAVALGHGKQEHFICSVLGNMPSIKIAIGVGGALDYLSGNIQRAPVWMRHLGFEWLYRLIQQPKRIGRIVNAVILFPLTVIWDRIKTLW